MNNVRDIIIAHVIVRTHIYMYISDAETAK